MTAVLELFDEAALLNRLVMIERVRQELDGGAEVPAPDAPNPYQDAFRTLFANAGPEAVNRIVRAAVVEASVGHRREPVRLGEAPSYGAAFNAAGTKVLARGYETAWVFNTGVRPADGSSKPIALHHGDRVYSAAINADSSKVFTAGAHGRARVWATGVRPEDGSGEPVALLGHEGPVVGATFNAAGTRVVACGRRTHGDPPGGSGTARGPPSCGATPASSLPPGVRMG
jgi:hypothetical protein